MTRSEMMDRMPASEYMEWLLLEKVEPFGDRRADLLAGILASTLVNLHLDKNAKPYTWSDLIPDWDGRHTRMQTPEQHRNMLLALQQQQEALIRG